MVATALFAFVAPVAHAQPKPDDGPDIVTVWNAVATSTLVQLPAPASGAPPALQINMAMTQGAVYDAVNAITPKHYRPYLLTRRFAATASREAAVSTAAYHVLSDIIETVPRNIAFPNRATLLQALAAHYQLTLSTLPDTPSTTQGIAAGNAVC